MAASSSSAGRGQSAAAVCATLGHRDFGQIEQPTESGANFNSLKAATSRWANKLPLPAARPSALRPVSGPLTLSECDTCHLCASQQPAVGRLPFAVRLVSQSACKAAPSSSAGCEDERACHWRQRRRSSNLFNVCHPAGSSSSGGGQQEEEESIGGWIDIWRRRLKFLPLPLRRLPSRPWTGAAAK